MDKSGLRSEEATARPPRLRRHGNVVAIARDNAFGVANVPRDENAARIMREELCRSASHHRGAARETFTRFDTGHCSNRVRRRAAIYKAVGHGDW